MKATTILMGIAICGALADSVSAQVVTFRSRAAGNWNSNANWEYKVGAGAYSNAPRPGGTGVGYDFPGADNPVVIDDYTITVNMQYTGGATGAYADSLTVTSDGILKVGSPNTFVRLSVDGGNPTHQIDGLITIGCNDIGNEMDSLLNFSTADQTIEGAGVIRGVHPDSLLQIGNAKTLTCKMQIEGLLWVMPQTGVATLLMKSSSGKLVANASGALVLENSLTLAENTTGGTPSYWATASGSELSFRNTSGYSLVGSVILNHCSARLDFEEDVVVDTAGTFTNGAASAPVGHLAFGTDASFCSDNYGCLDSGDGDPFACP